MGCLYMNQNRKELSEKWLLQKSNNHLFQQNNQRGSFRILYQQVHQSYMSDLTPE